MTNDSIFYWGVNWNNIWVSISSINDLFTCGRNSCGE